jgi:hypothetical protein
MIIIAKNAGTSVLADDDGLAAAQSVTAGAIALNGSLTVGGAWSNPGWGYKVKLGCAADETGKTVTVNGKFYASNSVGDYSTSITLAGSNAGSTTSALYATEVTGASISTASAGNITLGLAADSAGVPVQLPYGSTYQIKYGGTFAGATATLQVRDDLNAQWTDLETGKTAAAVSNIAMPVGSMVKAVVADGSATTAIGLSAQYINPTR